MLVLTEEAYAQATGSSHTGMPVGAWFPVPKQSKWLMVASCQAVE
jgi:hypothetical protein